MRKARALEVEEGGGPARENLNVIRADESPIKSNAANIPRSIFIVFFFAELGRDLERIGEGGELGKANIKLCLAESGRRLGLLGAVDILTLAEFRDNHAHVVAIDEFVAFPPLNGKNKKT